MRSYIKIYGPPVLEGIVALEKIAIDMPEVCIMDYFIKTDISPRTARELGGRPLQSQIVPGFFMNRTGVVVPVKRCQRIISKHGTKLGEYDFFFEWRKDPTSTQLDNLILRIDEAFKKIGCHYTITTK